jgi:signal transduction histidine kinase
MRQVLWNLVRNGVQATGAGTTVTVSVREDGDRILMAVSDEGPGIEADSVKKLFDAFYTTRTQGAGLGLAVVRRIIDEHAPYGATIDVRGKSPKGATFEVGLAPAASATKRKTKLSSATSPDVGASEVPATANAAVRPK